MGHQTWYKEGNKNRRRLINFAIPKRLVIKTTYHKHKKIFEWTWIHLNPNIKDRKKKYNEIDYMFNKKRNTNVLDVTSYRGAYCNFDHFLTISKIRTKLRCMTRIRPLFSIQDKLSICSYFRLFPIVQRALYLHPYLLLLFLLLQLLLLLMLRLPLLLHLSLLLQLLLLQLLLLQLLILQLQHLEDFVLPGLQPVG